MQNWENRRSLLINSFTFLLIFLGVYLLTSIAMGFVLSAVTNSNAWIWIAVCNVFMLIMVWSKFAEMREGIGYVMKKLGAIEVNQFNQNPIVARYMKVVVEMSIAAGIQTPKLYILPSYDINAFAISTNRKDTAIAVTEGSITRLTRSELQALVGHEISHILHGDPILNFKLIGWLYGLQSVYLYGYTMFHAFTRHLFGDFDLVNRFCLGYSMRTIGTVSRKANDGDYLIDIIIIFVTLPVILLSLLIMCVGAIGAISARIVKAIISRQREYLADSESVRFVRGHQIVKVLEKIAFLKDEDDESSTAMDADHQEFAHFYLQNYHEKTSIFDTHPPILKRIRKIQPAYRWPNQEGIEQLAKRWVDRNEMDDLVLVTALEGYSLSRLNNISHNISIELGLDKNSQIIFAKLAKCYAAFLSFNDVVTKKAQMDYLRAKLSHHLFESVARESHRLENMTDLQRLQSLNNELPNFDNLAKFQIQDIENICQDLIEMDDEVSIAEYCMILILRVHIAKSAHNHLIRFSAHKDSIETLQKPLSELLSVTMAIVFNQNPASAKLCYTDIAEFLQITIPYQENLSWHEVFDNALPLLSSLSAQDQTKLEEVFAELSQMPRLGSDGQCLLFILQRAFSFLY